ncbi:methyltransferase domain-containing protein [Sphingobacterium spiritivorum]|uniref:methyltransferase domain-containing protein n=1 Tax=Sphingobacterium spiritivorum TaxID=258 RepID=UPI003DA44C7E
MRWNPEQYIIFKKERFAPFYDLITPIEKKKGIQAIDLGCGTGELTRKLSDYLEDAIVTGIDASPEMLTQTSAFANDKTIFLQRDIKEQLDRDEKWDLIFSNAVLQWIPDHESLLPAIIRHINPGGQLAIQIPAQNDNILNILILELAQEEPYAKALNYWKKESPVLRIDDYAQLLFESGSKKQEVMQKVYPIIAQSPDDLYQFIAGSTLIPYLERIDPEMKEDFIRAYKEKIALHAKKYPALYSFKRNILYAAY